MSLRIINHGGSVAIGGTITGAVANEILYVDGSLHLAQSANLQFDGTAVTLGTGGAIKFGGSLPNHPNLYTTDGANLFLTAGNGPLIISGGSFVQSVYFEGDVLPTT